MSRCACWFLSFCLAALGSVCACDIARADSLYAWGWNAYGQLGDGTKIDRVAPVSVNGLESNVKSIDTGYGHSLALLSSGSVRGWGRNLFGEVGDGTWGGPSRLMPVAVAGLADVVSIAAGHTHSLAARSDGTVMAWGQSGPNGYPSPLPTQVTGISNAIEVAAGDSHALAKLSDGTAIGWGHNFAGQLGNANPTNYQPTPVSVIGLSNLSRVVAGGAYSLGLQSDGSASAWGGNIIGVLGDGTTTNKSQPVQILSNVVSIAAGFTHGLAALDDGTVWSWGLNTYGQLGDGTTASRLSPSIVPGLKDIVAVQANYTASYALSADGRVWSWGDNSYGQLGLGDTLSRLTVAEVPAPAGYHFTAISAGAHSKHVLAIAAPIPEPGTGLLSVVGALACAAFCWVSRNRKLVRAVNSL